MTARLSWNRWTQLPVFICRQACRRGPLQYRVAGYTSCAGFLDHRAFGVGERLTPYQKQRSADVESLFDRRRRHANRGAGELSHHTAAPSRGAGRPTRRPGRSHSGEVGGKRRSGAQHVAEPDHAVRQPRGNGPSRAEPPPTVNQRSTGWPSRPARRQAHKPGRGQNRLDLDVRAPASPNSRSRSRTWASR